MMSMLKMVSLLKSIWCDNNIVENKHTTIETIQRSDFNGPKPFTYIHRTTVGSNSLKSSQDLSGYSRYLSKASTVRKSRFESQKVSPHEFEVQESQNKTINNCSNMSQDEASENFSQVHEHQVYVNQRNVEDEPPK